MRPGRSRRPRRPPCWTPFEPRPEDLIPSPEPRFGGEIRFLVTDPSFYSSLIRSNVAEGLTAEGLLLSWSRPRPGNPCWVFELNPDWSWPDGLPVRAGDLGSVALRKAVHPPTELVGVRMLNTVCGAVAVWRIEPEIAAEVDDANPSGEEFHRGIRRSSVRKR